MKIIKFKHPDYGEMTTTVEYWVECNIFDATDEDGNCRVVNKGDCGDGAVEEI